MKTTVIFHSADFDGLFCREIARKFLPDAELIGWDFGDEPLPLPVAENLYYILDLPVDRVFGCEFRNGDCYLGNKMYVPKEQPVMWNHIVWIDHHKSSIETHPKDIPGYRIDGVAACRLAWFYFTALERYKAQTTTADFTWFQGHYPWATKAQFVNREVLEPLAVRLAGEYDIWCKDDPRAELFQHGLRSRDLTDRWPWLLRYNEVPLKSEIEELRDIGHEGLLEPDGTRANPVVLQLLESGRVLEYAREQEYKHVITQQGFDVEFEGLKFLACCSHELDIRSHLFKDGIKPHHDALFGFTWTGKDWRVSLYHAPGKEHHDLSVICVRHGGGGHRGAAGCRLKELDFLKSH